MRFLQSSLGKAITVCAALGVVALVVYLIVVFSGSSDSARTLNKRWLVCTKTLKPYQVDLATIKEFPAPSPFSGENTGQPAELCYWTSDGQPKKDPTPVLLNKYRDLPEPTFCPDCGRLVVERNPGADPGAKPPMTREEYEARRANP